jgi:hypothetical protein
LTGTKRIKAQFTNPTPAPDGDYGVAGGQLVQVDSSGVLHQIGKPLGVAFALHATSKHGVDVASVSGDNVTVERFSGNSKSTLGSGKRGRLQLFGLRGGGSALVGDIAGVAKTAPEVTRLESKGRVQTISGQGHLVANSLLPRQTADVAASPLATTASSRAGAVSISVRTTKTGQEAVGSLSAETTAVLRSLIMPRA